MTKMSFVIVQHDRRAQPSRVSGRYGTLSPVNMDGFYASQADAEGVARFMAEERPDLDTLVLRVVGEVKP